MENRKRGRPTENPKPYKVTAKLDNESKEILDTYCREKEVSMMEAIRRGIKKLKEDLQK